MMSSVSNDLPRHVRIRRNTRRSFLASCTYRSSGIRIRIALHRYHVHRLRDDWLLSWCYYCCKNYEEIVPSWIFGSYPQAGDQSTNSFRSAARSREALPMTRSAPP